MGRRTVLLLAALVVAALGTALVFLYITNYTAKQDENAVLVTVLAATDTIPAGTTGAAAAQAGAFETVQVQRKTLPDGYLTDPSPIAEQVALAPVFPGQVILQQMFGAASPDAGLAIPNGQLAVAVEVGDPNRVAGFVAPGSEVAVFATLSGPTGGPQTQLLLPRSTVIAVGPTTVTTRTTTETTGNQNTEEISRAILTLAVSQKDAQRLIYAQSQGALYFALLSDGSQVGAGAPTNEGNLFN